jgi:ABC-2 type transport system ATP-binding protein
MLELQSVSKSFSGICAVDRISFEALAGEITGYLGPNGSGKSTTIKMITGLLELTSGEILFNSIPIKRDPVAFRQSLGYVPEEPHLYAHLSALEFLNLVAQLRNMPRRTYNQRIDGLLQFFSLQFGSARSNFLLLERHAAESLALGRASAQSLAHRPG